LLYSPISSVHAEIQAFGDIESDFNIERSCINELGTYQVKRSMLPQTRYAFQPNPIGQ